MFPNGSLGNDVYTRSTADVTITILDVNDNPPQFSQSHYSVNISEALQNGQALPDLLMSVTDSDQVRPKTHAWLICGSSSTKPLIDNP